MKVKEFFEVIRDGFVFCYILEEIAIIDDAYNNDIKTTNKEDRSIIETFGTEEYYKFIKSNWMQEIERDQQIVNREIIGIYHGSRYNWEENYKNLMLGGSELEGTVDGYFIIVK